MSARGRFEQHRLECAKCRANPLMPCELGKAIIFSLLTGADPGPRGQVVIALKLESGISPEDAERQMREAGRILDGACALAERSGVSSTIFLAQVAKLLGAGLGHYHQEAAEGAAVDPDDLVNDLVRWFHAVAAEAFSHLTCQAGAGPLPGRVTSH